MSNGTKPTTPTIALVGARASLAMTHFALVTHPRTCSKCHYGARSECRDYVYLETKKRELVERVESLA